MDRPAGPCGPAEFVFVVFLGGWAAFVVLPALLAWLLGATIAFLAILRRARRLN
jgi:hypothetical protein